MPGLCQDNIANESKFLTVGDVSKIDSKNKSITLTEATSYNISQLSNAGGGGGTATGGRASSRGGVNVSAGGGGRAGRRGGGGAAPSAGRVASAPLPMEYRVTISSKTVLKDGDTEIKIDDLKVGDRLQVFSMKGGTKLEATEIIRTPKDKS